MKFDQWKKEKIFSIINKTIDRISKDIELKIN